MLTELRRRIDLDLDVYLSDIKRKTFFWNDVFEYYILLS